MNVQSDEYRLNYEEMKAFFRIINKSVFQLIKLIVLIYVIAIGPKIFTLVTTPDGETLVKDIVFWSVVCLAFIGLLIWSIKQSFNAIKNNPLMAQSHVSELSDNYISESYEDGSFLKYNVNLLSKVVKEKDFYIFYRDSSIVFVFPERIFTSEADIEEIEGFLIEKKLLSLD